MISIELVKCKNYLILHFLRWGWGQECGSEGGVEVEAGEEKVGIFCKQKSTEK